MAHPYAGKVKDGRAVAAARYQSGGEVHPLNNRPILQGRDGKIATEESITLTHPRLNSGAPTNIPSIWGGKRPPFKPGTEEFENWAVERALESGGKFDSYSSIEEAVAAAKERSKMLGRGY